jgi:hypothetical protein
MVEAMEGIRRVGVIQAVGESVPRRGSALQDRPFAVPTVCDLHVGPTMLCWRPPPPGCFRGLTPGYRGCDERFAREGE